VPFRWEPNHRVRQIVALLPPFFREQSVGKNLNQNPPRPIEPVIERENPPETTPNTSFSRQASAPSENSNMFEAHKEPYSDSEEEPESAFEVISENEVPLVLRQSLSTGEDQVPLEVAGVYENERYLPFRGWGAPVLPGDPPSWTSADGTHALPPSLRDEKGLREGVLWTSQWRVHRDHSTDEDGWAYSARFEGPRKWTPFGSWSNVVRRRRWYRLARALGPTFTKDALSSSG